MGSITSIQAVYVPADDLTDPAPATTFSHLDATTVLSRALASKGIYPAGRSVRFNFHNVTAMDRKRKNITNVLKTFKQTLQRL